MSKNFALLKSMLDRATIVTVDGGPHLHSWGSSELNGEDTNEIYYFTWETDGYTFSSILTEGGVSSGSFDENGTFTCEDNNGDETKINCYSLSNILPNLDTKEAPPPAKTDSSHIR